MNRIAIIGGGWLGRPLAKHLLSESCPVIISRTTEEGVNQLASDSLPGFQLKLGENGSQSQHEFVHLLKTHTIDTIIGAFPPGFRQGKGREYVIQWQSLIASALEANIKKVLMISSTAVYPDTPTVMQETDASAFLAQNEASFSAKARTLLEAEQIVIESGLDYVILRFSGLFGPGRHPARFVEKLSSISTKAPANMLHQEDAIGVVRFALSSLNREIVNATTPNSLNKWAFYQQAMKNYSKSVPLPPTNALPGKKISTDKLIRLGYQYIYPDISDGLAHCSS